MFKACIVAEYDEGFTNGKKSQNFIFLIPATVTWKIGGTLSYNVEICFIYSYVKLNWLFISHITQYKMKISRYVSRYF